MFIQAPLLQSSLSIRSAKLEEEIGNIEGVLIEKKKFSFTLHYRMANKADAAFVRKTFYKIISENTERQSIAILKGKKVLELVPNVSWDKGKAALLIIKQLEKRCLPDLYRRRCNR